MCTEFMCHQQNRSPLIMMKSGWSCKYNHIAETYLIKNAEHEREKERIIDGGSGMLRREHECERVKRASIPLGAVVAFDGDNRVKSHCTFDNLLAAQLALRAIRLGVLHGMLERHCSCDCSSSPGCTCLSLQHQTLFGFSTVWTLTSTLNPGSTSPSLSPSKSRNLLCKLPIACASKDPVSSARQLSLSNPEFLTALPLCDD